MTDILSLIIMAIFLYLVYALGKLITNVFLIDKPLVYKILFYAGYILIWMLMIMKLLEPEHIGCPPGYHEKMGI